MTATAQSVQPSGLGFLGGYRNDLYFDHWFDGEHPKKAAYVAIRDSRPAFVRLCIFPPEDPEYTWKEVHEHWFPHVVTGSNVSIMGMLPGEYLAGLYNLDGLIRTSAYIGSMSLMAGLRLAIGRLSNMVYISAHELSADRPASLRDLEGVNTTNMEVYRFIVIPFHFPAHWTVVILDQATKTFYFFDSQKDDRIRRADAAMNLIQEVLSQTQFSRGDLAKNLDLRVMDLLQQQGSWNCGLIALESVRVFFREHDVQRSDQ